MSASDTGAAESWQSWSDHREAIAARLKGPRIHDARIAALCLHHGVRELWSANRDFSAFPELKVRNPLVNLRKSRSGCPYA
jgi:uncharacterized protein